MIKLLVGWWCKDTGQLTSIPGFDRVRDPERWLPVHIEIEQGELAGLLMDMAKRLQNSESVNP